MDEPPIILWFRLDLRLADNPALAAATALGLPIIPVFIWAPEEERAWAPGAASRVWLHHSLVALAESLKRKNAQLVLRTGSSALSELRKLISETGAGSIFWNRRYEPAVIKRDEVLERELTAGGYRVKSFNSALLFEPWEILNSQKKPYQIFGAFERACRKKELAKIRPLPAPTKLLCPKKFPKSCSIDDFKLLPKIDWANGIQQSWAPGEAGARKNLDRFLKHGLSDYDTRRNLPDCPGTSRLSPHLHFGELSPRTIWHALKQSKPKPRGRGRSTYEKELLWREFAYHLLYHFPETPDEPLKQSFRKFPWRKNQGELKLWQKGCTGFPIVDAGTRELWATGWMHNRVRMIVASFLVKDLLIPWTEGAQWFWDTLVDADLANNTLGWQWTAGCGADAAPYFRVFNPVLQGKKFDPEGNYVRSWVPELARLPKKWIHQPWEAPPEILADAGVVLGRNYPRPIVNHYEAKDRALDAYETLRKGG